MKLFTTLLLAALALPLLAQQKIEPQVLLLEDGGRIRVTAQAPTGFERLGLNWSFTITTPEGVQCGTLPQVRCTASKLNCTAPLPELPERARLVLNVALTDKKNKALVSGKVNFATPPKPLWRDFKEGIPDGTVPSPWEPVELNGKEVTLWGRKFLFDNAPLPAQIWAKGEALLAEPMKVVLAPAPASWNLLSAERKDDTTVEFRWQAQAGSITYLATTQIYFDGVIRLDVTIPGGKAVSSFALEMPCRADLLSYVHRGPWQFGGMKTGYPVSARKENFSIRNVFYLLNEEVGLCWFDGMQFDWKLNRPGQALELIPSAKVNTLRINYIDNPAVYKQDRVFTAGFQALPARPMPDQCPQMQMSYSVVYRDEDPAVRPAWFSPVEYNAPGNFNPAQGTVEMFVKPVPGQNMRRKTFFQTSHGRYYILNFGYDANDGVFFQIYEFGQNKIDLKSKRHIPAGKWSHVAVSWGDVTRIYVNGELAAEEKRKGSTAVMPVLLHAGSSDFAVDSIRVSSIPRTSFVTDAQQSVDEPPLLLDNCDKTGYVNGRYALVPEKISADGEAGYFTPDGAVEDGFRGQCIAPWTAPKRSMIEGYALLGAKALMYHASQYTDEACAGMYIYDEAALNKSVQAIHENGMKALFYINNSLSNKDRMWDTHREDWLITPKGYPFTSAEHPGDQSYQACPRSEYIDYFFWRLAENLDNYQLDGAFLDGRMYTSCDNALHGCGVVNFEGKRVPQRDVWDGRLKSWRLYNILEARGAYGEQHKSSLWDAPTCFFWHGIWEGEQFMNLKLDGRKKLDILPLEGYRMILNGFPYGMPTRFASYVEQPFSAVENCTFAFVHGNTWTQTYRINEMQVLSPYWLALESFGAGYDSFIPYWAKNPPAVKTPHDLVKVSAYAKDGKALVIVANFDEDQPRIQGDITLNLKAMGLKDIRICDAFSNEEIPVQNGDAFRIDLKSFRQAWFLVEPRE
ncbi:MAG: hypothetical protein J6S21_04990 [Victivallales bacterium]|nr:hypothetical protein [Victivallales bacterium]